jgi:predicted ATP-dependent endonuclease of OLD family
MLKLQKVEIQNFRSCKSLEVQLSSFSPLVGYNNAGKSNIMDAIRWVLHHGALDESDFYDPDEPVMVTAYVEGINEEVLDGLSEIRRERIEPFVRDDGHCRFRRYQPTPSGTKGNIELEAYRFSPDEEDEQEWVESPTGLNRTIQTLFPEPIEVRAMEDAAEDIGKSKSTSTIGRLIAEVLNPGTEEIADRLQSPLQTLQDRLAAGGNDRLEALDDLDAGATETVNEYFPGLKIRTHVPVPDAEELFADGTIQVIDEMTDEPQDVSAMGHGAQRSIQMALVHHLAEQSSNETEAETAKLVLVDEPELYLHPQAVESVRKSLKDLSESNYQVVFATHSPLMIEGYDIPYTNVVHKSTSEGTKVRKRVVDAIEEVIEDKATQRKLLFSLENASQILFSDRVLLVEGKTERRLVSRLYKEITDKTLQESRIGLVGAGGGGGIPNCYKILDAMGMNVRALVDLDFVFLDAIQHDLLERGDAHIQSCKQKHNDEAGVLNSADGARHLVERGIADTEIQRLHEEMKDQGYWVWTAGAIEDHLGLDGKDESVWADFNERLKENDFEEVVDDSEGVRELVEWLDEM